MYFEDLEIDELDLTEENDFYKFFIECLCGRRFQAENDDADSEADDTEVKHTDADVLAECTEEDFGAQPRRAYTGRLLRETEWKVLKQRMTTLRAQEICTDPGATHIRLEQLNEILLLLNQDRLGSGFFGYFFGDEVTNEEGLKAGVTRFRGFALLRFGNVRFAFDTLRQLTRSRIGETLSAYDPDWSLLNVETLKERPREVLQIREIPRDDTVFTGETAGLQFNTENDLLKCAAKGLGNLSGKELSDLRQFYETFSNAASKDELVANMVDAHLNEYRKLHKRVLCTIARAQANTDVYLTWDFMDIYIATSMRLSWEFEECWDFLQCLQGAPELENIWPHLRVFNPTQSKCYNRIDKGLLESLMLKRVRCTIYMAQETDTMGKDSELAATLAQGKPVIAYIPKGEDITPAQLRERPLDYHWRRLLSLMAEGIVYDKDFEQRLVKQGLASKNLYDAMNFVLGGLSEYVERRLFTLSATTKQMDQRFKTEHSVEFENLLAVLCVAQCLHYEKRAELLKNYHPLSLQVNLTEGVANGVLVVRTPSECATLLWEILSKRMHLVVSRHTFPGQTMPSETLVLTERITGCVFRVQTAYERLSNSFWNLYMTDRRPPICPSEPRAEDESTGE